MLADLRDAKLINSADFERDEPEDCPDLMPLPEHVDAKASQSRDGIGEVNFFEVVESFSPFRVENRQKHRRRFFFVHGREIASSQVSMNPKDRGIPGLDMQVARIKLDDLMEELF
jgi:hypothetical protein